MRSHGSYSWEFAVLVKWAVAHSLTTLPVSAKDAVKSNKNKPSIVNRICFAGGTKNNPAYPVRCLSFFIVTFEDF